MSLESQDGSAPDYSSMFPGLGGEAQLPAQIVSPYLDVNPAAFTQAQPVSFIRPCSLC